MDEALPEVLLANASKTVEGSKYQCTSYIYILEQLDFYLIGIWPMILSSTS